MLIVNCRIQYPVILDSLFNSLSEGPVAGEGAVYKPTAMTSPHATAGEVVAAMATTKFDDNQEQIDLTAVENTEDAPPNIAQEEIQGAIMPEENAANEPPGGNAEEEQIREETVNETEDATISNGIDHIQDSKPAQPPVLSMDALAALLAYAQPNPDGFAAPQIPAAGLPFLQAAINASVEHHPFMDPIPYNREMDDPGLSAYAKLIFEDGFFFMTTYSLVLGRDTAAARAALRREEAEERRILDEELTAREPKTPVQPRREESRYSKSVVSESGGIFREGDDSDSDERERRRKSRKTSKKSRSTGSSSRHISRRNSLVQPNEPIVYQPQVVSRRSAPETAGAVPVDPASLRPSPYDCPTIGIHPPASTPASAYKGISRQHVKIAYNTTKDFFELEIMGRNGAFVDGEFHHHNNVVPLKSGSQLQIGGVVVRFMLPDVVIGETGPAQRQTYDEDPRSYSEGGKEMSFDFEDDPRAGMLYETSEGSASEDEGAGNEELEDEGAEVDEEEEDEVEDEDDGDEEDADEDENDLESSDHSKMVGDQGQAGEDEGPDEEGRPDPTFNNQKKRGPGRPPKNGIMSKREQQLAKKEALAQEKAKKTVPQAPVPGKNKVGRPRKHPRPDTPPIKTEKRKYTKRKPKEPKDPKHEGSGGEDQPAKEKKEKKPPKPPRSPSPQFNEAELTPEQLAKPQANYVTLIHEALSNSETGQMSLPQIYRAIQRKYPFFVLKCSTNGWQSSVRHNLSQHHAFKKVERDGKGWMWAIVDGVSIEKEKKRRATPPMQLPPGHMYHQPIYQAGQPHMMHPYGTGMMGPPPGYPMNHQLPPNMRPGQPPSYMGPPPQTNGHPPPPGSHPGMTGLPPPGFSATMPPQLAPSHGATSYSSPYAPKPPPSTPSQSSEQRAPTENPPPTQGPPPAAPRQQPTPPQIPQQTAQQNHPASNENTIRAIELFKARMIASLKGDTTNVEAIVDSAINRVLGRTGQSGVPGDPQEAKIMLAVENMVNLINGKPGNENQPPPQNQPNQNATKPSAAPESGKGPNSEKPARTVMRPTFTGQSQNRQNVPRPPMNTPGMKRTNSGSPANAPPRPSAPSSASPAPAPAPSSGNGANTAKLLVTENGQLAGQKRAHDEADDMREFKRLSTSGPPQLKT